MVNAINGGASQLYAFFRGQATRTQNTLPTGSQAEKYAVKHNGQAKSATLFSVQAKSINPFSNRTFSALLKAQEAIGTQDEDGNAVNQGTRDYAAVPKSYGFDTVIQGNYQPKLSTQEGQSGAPDGKVVGAHGDRFSLNELYANNPKTEAGHFDLDEIAGQLIVPSAENVKAITAHVNARFKELLKDYSIPQAPEQITYDNEGRLQLPADYAYGDEVTQALGENPGVARELHDLDALASHFVGLQRSLAFSAEYSQASSQAEADALLAKYSDLFSDGNKNTHIALTFSAEGDLSMMANGNPIQFA